jgi:hypothetical protein
MLAEFGEIADQQLAAKGKAPLSGGLKSGKPYLLKPTENIEDSEGSGSEEIVVEELTDVGKPAKERQKASPVDCTALGKAKQQLYHMINVLIHSAYYSVLVNWTGWSSKNLTPTKSWLVESNLKKHETSVVLQRSGSLRWTIFSSKSVTISPCTSLNLA